ncbi:MAG: hypothetical protein O2955_05650 [Planctomycetota bacterium]|nr:hypothetical protein [Planctomycetota bacterium]MDA1211977.1 hypothetical protein [Planctomycetota bacterium]
MNSLATNSDAIPQSEASQGLSRVVRQCLVLTLGIASLWVVLYFPASRIAGSRGIEGLTYAALLCLAPGYIALLLTHVMVAAGSHAGNGAMLSTALRLMVVGIAVVLLQSARPDLRFWHFHIWVVVFYGAALALETCFILKGVRRSPSTPQQSH